MGIKFISEDCEWYVFERTEQDGMKAIKVAHLCSGPEEDRKILGVAMHESMRTNYNNTKDWDSTPICSACEKKVPDNVAIMVKLDNAPI